MRRAVDLLVVVVDTNVLLASLMRGGIVRRILLSNPAVWAVPDLCLEELWEHREVWNLARIPDGRLADTLAEFAAGYLTVYDERHYGPRLEEAANLIRDADDAPVLALAFSIENEGIWTFNPRDYAPAVRKGRAELLTTTRVGSMYPPDPAVP